MSAFKRLVFTLLVVFIPFFAYPQRACLTYFLDNYQATDNCYFIEGVPNFIISNILFKHCPKFSGKTLETHNYTYEFGEKQLSQLDGIGKIVFDTSGNLVETHNFNGTVETIGSQKYEITDSGKIITEYTSDSENKYEKTGLVNYNYDVKGKLQTVIMGGFNTYTGEGTYGKYEFNCKWLLNYNDQGLIVTVKKFQLSDGDDGPSGQEILAEKTQLVYDNLKRLTSILTVDKYTGGFITKLRFVYAPNKISLIQTEYATNDFRTDFIYDSKGKILAEEDYWNEGNKLIRKKKYSYDSNNKLSNIDFYEDNIIKKSIEIRLQ
jgi:hypothetical protein